ncbi:ABC transporter ATP-binding protein [Methanothrix sp.]|uniref:ABC transporter ATP-binding protein n=1 Tax=Methanothrix sp. TaxID=90426 RepID=UPI001BD517B9
MSLLEVKHLDVGFKTKLGTVEAVNDVSFHIDKGEIFGFIGESGSGKSVIGMSLLRLLPRDALVKGSAIFEGTDLLDAGEEEMQRLRGKEIAFIPQNPSDSLNPLMKNGQQISEVFEAKGHGRKEAKDLALKVMKRLLIRDPRLSADRYPHQLSGGMKQRLLTGISLSLQPRLVIADEPTKGLGSITRRSSIEFYQGLEGKKDRSMLLITHDLDLAYEICDRLAVLYAGEIVEMGPAKKLLDDPLHPYTQGLINSLPKNGLVPLEGSSPSLLDLPRGCFFSERCRSCISDCIKSHPKLAQNGGWMKRCILP